MDLNMAVISGEVVSEPEWYLTETGMRYFDFEVKTERQGIISYVNIRQYVEAYANTDDFGQFDVGDRVWVVGEVRYFPLPEAKYLSRQQRIVATQIEVRKQEVTNGAD